MRKDIYKDGKQFSKDYQPPNESKRKPKWKTRLKEMLSENYDEISKAIIEKCKEGDIRHIEFLRDWLYGKVKDKISVEGSFNKQLQDYINARRSNKRDDDS